MTALRQFLDLEHAPPRRHHPGERLDCPADRLATRLVCELVAVDLADVPAWLPQAGSVIAGDVDDLAATA